MQNHYQPGFVHLPCMRFAMHAMRMRTNEPIPTVSRTFADGTLVETLFDAGSAITSFAVREPDGSVHTTDWYDAPTGERLVPYAATNNLLTTGCVLLPSALGEVGDVGDIIADIGAYLDRYVMLSPGFRAVVPYYVLLTWVYDAFQELGYLRLRGTWGSGKTRGLITIGSLCYKPFFASGASTVSPIFHILDSVGATLVLDEADLRFSDATADLTKVLNNGNVAGLPVLRTMTNRSRELNPQAFRVYGPKILAMRESFQDEALESRFLTEDTCVGPLPPHIPIHLPQSLKAEAQVLRNRLLAWRLRERWNVAPDPARLLAGASARANQTALALLSLVDDATARDRIEAFILGGENRRQEERRSTDEARMIAAILAARAGGTTPATPVAAVAREFNAGVDDGDRQTNKAIGWIIRGRLGIATVKSHGTYAIPPGEIPKVAKLAQQFGVVPPTP